MKTYLLYLLLGGLLALGPSAGAQIILSADINERGVTPLTMAGFESFVINSNVSVTAIQTNGTTRVIGGISVTLSNTAPLGYDDRVRATPVNAGAFTDELLLRDFVLSREVSGTGGLDLSFAGLTPAQAYLVTIWSFDNSSPGLRTSDWFGNGGLGKGNYAFNGTVLPTSNNDYKFSFKVSADAAGLLLVQGRRKSTSTNAAGNADIGVFLNAFQLELTTPDPPTAASAQAIGTAIFAGDNTILSAQVGGGTPPFTYQWRRDGVNVPAATNNPQTLFNLAAGDSGQYAVVVSNSSGSVTSSAVQITVQAVASIRSGLIAHWPLNQLGASTPDAGGSANTLFATNMDASNLGPGRCGSSPAFNGTDEYLTLTHNTNGGLPASSYTSYTVAMWVKGSFTGQSDRRVFAESSTNSNTPLLTIGTDTAGAVSGVDIFIRSNDGGTPINHRKSTLPVFDGNWHHIAWVDNNSYGRVYVDGVLDTTDFTYARGALSLTTIALGGLQRATAGSFFNGMIDEPAIWRRALSQTDIQAVINNGPNLTPSITCPSDVTLGTTPGQCSATGVSLTAPYTGDNCAVASVTSNAPATFPLGLTVVTWTVTDLNGQSATCTQNVTINDTQPPTLTCPPDVTVNGSPGSCTVTGVALGSPSTSDNCGVAGVVSNAPASYFAGMNQVIWTVTDIHGLTATCTQKVIVVKPPPVAGLDGFSTTQNQPGSIAALKLIHNDTDPDNGPLTVTAVSPTSTNGGSVVLNSGVATYTPLPGFTGIDRFSYTVNSSCGVPGTGQVEVFVPSGNLPPQNQLSLTPIPNGYRVRFAAIPGRSYQVQRSPDMNTWTTLATVAAPPHGVIEFDDTNPPQPTAFYRMALP